MKNCLRLIVISLFFGNCENQGKDRNRPDLYGEIIDMRINNVDREYHGLPFAAIAIRIVNGTDQIRIIFGCDRDVVIMDNSKRGFRLEDRYEYPKILKANSIDTLFLSFTLYDAVIDEHKIDTYFSSVFFYKGDLNCNVDSLLSRYGYNAQELGKIELLDNIEFEKTEASILMVDDLRYMN